MAVDEALNTRLREALAGLPDLREQKMMGGTCFMVNGHMVAGAHREKDGRRRLMFRVGRENGVEAAAIGGGEAAVMGGRVMSGIYFLDAEELSEEAFTAWRELAVGNVLAPKTIDGGCSFAELL
ncbi:TfoX/Sxy family protein [Algicella marina]|uniref:RNA methyltransferase n=1 Tax=Algicella marina TaxID=2683284 RepID=A0A6P1SYU3_9RHOB|nr:TfoX/Sxy family protein [Algicella marina]QHQ35854.1 RNA methyltransferase [Algicella marina]